MKTTWRSLILLSVLSFSQTGFGQQKPMRTLFSSDSTRNIRGFGFFSLGGTTMNNEGSFMAGGGGGIFLNRQFAIGLMGQGIKTSTLPSNLSATYDKMAMGYGGLLMNYFPHLTSPFNFSFPLAVGVGAVGLEKYNDKSLEEPRERKYDGQESLLWVLEPGVNMNLNITRTFIIGLNISYRWVIDEASTHFTKQDLSSLSVALNFNFGKFYTN